MQKRGSPRGTLGWHMAGLGASIPLIHFSRVRPSLRLNLCFLFCKPGTKGSQLTGGACWEGSRWWLSQKSLPLRKDSCYLGSMGKWGSNGVGT